MKNILYKIQIVIACLLLSFMSQGQLKQGSIVITHSGAQWTNINSINCSVSNNINTTIEVSVLDASNTSGIPFPSNTYPWTPFTAGNNKPAWWHPNNWIEANLGRVFGLTLSDCGDIYVANTSIRSGEGTSGIKDAIMKLDATTGVITTAFIFPGTNPNLGLGNIKYFKVGSAEYMAATWWEDNSLNILVNTGTCKAPKWVLKDKYVIKGIGIPYGIAYRNFNNKNSIYFGTINGNTSATVYAVDLTPAVTFTAMTPVPQITVNWPGSVPYTYSVCAAPNDIPVADISFSSDYKKILFAEQGLCCANQITAHNSALFEYAWNGAGWSAASGKYPAGMALLNGKHFNTAGGVSYWNNILYENNKLSCDTTALFTSDAIYVGNATYPSSNFNYASGTTAYVYGFQAIKSMNNYATDIAAYNQTLKVDADDYFGNYDKWSLGDIEAYNPPLNCATPKCDCGKWDSISLNNNHWWQNNSTPPPPIPVISFNQGQATGVLFPYYTCSGTGCAVTFSYQITGNNGTVVTVNGNAAGALDLGQEQINALPCGNYFLDITPTCGGVKCPPVRIPVVINCPPACPPCAGTVTIDQSQVSVVTQNNTSSINPVSIATTSFTLTANQPVTEVRVLIDEFRLTTSSGNENCILCKNKPQTWANINAGNLTGVSFQPMISPASFPPALEKDIREMVFNNGPSTFFNLSGNTLNLTLGIPGVTGLNCCTLKAEVCVKFIIRDVNCCEKEIMKCFTFNLQ